MISLFTTATMHAFTPTMLDHGLASRQCFGCFSYKSVHSTTIPQYIAKPKSTLLDRILRPRETKNIPFDTDTTIPEAFLANNTHRRLQTARQVCQPLAPNVFSVLTDTTESQHGQRLHGRSPQVREVLRGTQLPYLQ